MGHASEHGGGTLTYFEVFKKAPEVPMAWSKQKGCCSHTITPLLDAPLDEGTVNVFPDNREGVNICSKDPRKRAMIMFRDPIHFGV